MFDTIMEIVFLPIYLISCHNDDGEASEALLDFYAAYAAAMIKQVGMQMAPKETKEYMDKLATCSDDQLGALTRFASINFDYEVSDDMLPSTETLTEKMTTGHTLVVNEERMKQLEERMKEVFKKSGLNGLPMK